MNTCKKIIGYINRINRDHVPRTCLLQGYLLTVHYCYTHRSSAVPGGPLGGLPFLSLTIVLDTLGRVAKPLVSHLTPVHPPESFRP